MTIYENEDDRKLQTETVLKLADHFLNQPFTGRGMVIRETPESGRMSHDVEFWWYDKFIGVGEIKCRNLSTSLVRDYGWYFERERIVKLNSQFKAKDVLLILRTTDPDVLYVTLEQLVANSDKIKPAPEGVMKDDHGSKTTAKKGIIIPGELLTCIT